MLHFFSKSKNSALKVSEQYSSPNFNERANGQAPSMLVLHYTGMQSAEAAIERLCDPEAEVSAHYVIDEGGQVFNLVSDQHRAWHAGRAYWNGMSDLNSASIGIEIVNPGHEFGYRAFPQVQIDAVSVLCRELIEKYGIVSSHILGHSDIAPGRKIDPGELFPWEGLSQCGIGLWPAPIEMDYQAAEDLILNTENILSLLANFGYNEEYELPILMREFHRHFYPEKFKDGENPDEPDVLSIAKLLSVLRLSHEENS